MSDEASNQQKARDDLIDALLVWDVEALRRRFSRESQALRLTMSLSPLAFSEAPRVDLEESGSPLLDAATEVLRNWALGEKHDFDDLAELRGLRAREALFRDLWRAWIDDDNTATLEASAGLERSRLPAHLRARGFTKLAVWSQAVAELSRRVNTSTRRYAWLKANCRRCCRNAPPTSTVTWLCVSTGPHTPPLLRTRGLTRSVLKPALMR